MSDAEPVLPRRAPRKVPPRSVRERTWDGTMVDELRALQETGEPDIVAEILETFRADATELVRGIATQSAARNCAAVEHAAHRLRGGSLSVGAQKVAAAAHELEQAAHAQDAERLWRLSQAVALEWSRFVAKSES